MGSNRSETLEVDIERILPGGIGLAHAEGRTILVGLAAPGDRLRIKIDRSRRSAAFGSIVEILKPSMVRVEPPCPYFGRCGGCDFQQLTYDAQLRAKSDMLRDCLRRIARIEDPPDVQVVPSPREWHYRSRAAWNIDYEHKSVGYYERGTHRVCDIAECAVLVPQLQELLHHLRDSLPSYQTQIDAVAGEQGVSVAPEIDGFQTQDVTRRINNENYQFSANSFFQINHDLLDKLVVAAIADRRGGFALDLYCGVGLFTLPLARRFLRVIGIESNAASSRYARRNLTNANLANAKIITAKVGEWLKYESSLLKGIEFLLLDPPRTGVERDTLEGILLLGPAQICYVSCDPATLARDLKSLLTCGYTLESIAAFDMFPQTHHVETVVHLMRSN